MPTLPIGDFSLGMLELGTRKRLWLQVFSSLTGDIAVPALIARGRHSGPTILSVAGVHGDEYEGMEAIRWVFDSLDPGAMWGAFIGIPVANPLAYEARSRVAPPDIDGLNLARTFPGDPVGSPSQMLAHYLLRFVLDNLTEHDLFLDFHSGSADVSFAPLIGFRDIPGAACRQAEEAARHFGFPRLWRIPDSPGPFNAETARRGITTLGTETTGRAGCERDDVAGYVQGLRNLLSYLGILKDVPRPERSDGVARTTINLLAPATGFMRVEKQLNNEVVAGDLLATIISPFGEPITEIVTPNGGTVWAARTMPAIRTGELAYMLALPA